MILKKLSSIDILALTIYGESRNQGILGQIAVGCVIRNRVKKNPSYLTFKKVCLKKSQFSCWNLNDPNRIILENLANKIYNKEEIQDKIYTQCEFIAKGIYNDYIIDITKSSDHYFADYIEPPSWSKKMKLMVKIGNHLFYKS